MIRFDAVYKEVTSATFGQKGKDVIDGRNLLKYSLLGTAVVPFGLAAAKAIKKFGVG
jgi:hypothetical protein